MENFRSLSPSKNFGRPLLILSFLLIAIPSLRLGYFAVSPLDGLSENTQILLIQKGEAPREIARKLIANKIIDDEKTFVFLGKILRQWKWIKAGEYAFSPAMSPLKIFSVLRSGISVPHPVTVREGENMYEIAADLATKNLANREKFLQLCEDPKLIQELGLKKDPNSSDVNSPLVHSIEGYLYPDTYFFNRTMSETDMIKQMVRRFSEFWTKDLETQAAKLQMNRHDVVTLASIVEKETGAPDERPIISSVFHNRLRLKMKLQSDPTTIYGIWDQYSGNLHKKDLATKNAYNTYHVTALPIGPISNPGKAALMAALFPATTSFLYFVSQNNGTHQFSENFKDHNLAVDRFQKDPKARLGKSWRDRLLKDQKKKEEVHG